MSGQNPPPPTPATKERRKPRHPWWKRTPLDTSGGHPPTAEEFATARAIVARSGVLDVLRQKVDSLVGRRRGLSVEAVLVAFQVNGLRRGHKARLVEVARILNAMTPEQRGILGVRHWNPDETYDRVDRLFNKIIEALETGCTTVVDGVPTKFDITSFKDQWNRASMPNRDLRRSARLAIDGTDFETSGKLHGEIETVDIDADEDYLAEDDKSLTKQERRRSKRPRRVAKILGIGPEGRKQYTKDPDARAGHRSATNSRPAGPFIGYELHVAVQIRDVAWSDGIERVKFDPDVPQVILNWNLVPAGSHRARAIVPTILEAKDNGQLIKEVVWDSAYPMSKPEFCGHPLHRAGIEQSFRPAKRQQWIKPFSEDAVDIAGQLFSSLLPDDLKQVLPMPPRDATIEECLEFERPFNRRARFRYGRHAGPDADGTTRWECPVCGGRLRAREVPWSMRRPQTLELVSLPEGKDRCCSGILSASAAELPLSQPLTFGTSAWREAYNKRQLAETAFSGLKDGFVNMTREFCRVFGLVKRTFLLAFSIAGYNIDRTRAFLARMAEEKKRQSAPRKRAKRREGTFDELLGPLRVATGPDPPPD